MFDRFFSGALVFGLMAISTAMLVVLMFAPKAPTAPMLRNVELARVVITASRDAAAAPVAGAATAQPVMQRQE